MLWNHALRIDKPLWLIGESRKLSDNFLHLQLYELIKNG